MTDITINGVIVFKDTPEGFAEDFNALLSKHSAYFKGSIKSYEFDEAEIVEDEEMDN